MNSLTNIDRTTAYCHLINKSQDIIFFPCCIIDSSV